MLSLSTKIGDHTVLFRSASRSLLSDLAAVYPLGPIAGEDTCTDLVIDVSVGYGQPYSDQTCSVTVSADHRTYQRLDYLMETGKDFSRTTLQAHDLFSIRHALMNLYSAYIVHHEWGLLLHSSCVIDRGRAFIFAGQSGAGKSTVAQLSSPRQLLSDEASIIRIRPGDVQVLDSPFRSETKVLAADASCPLAAIHLLIQSPSIKRSLMSPAESAFELLSKIFYWAADEMETRKALRLYRALLGEVPTYRLEFQKNDLFWEAIS